MRQESTRTLQQSGVGWSPYTTTLAATFSYDSEGRMNQETYPTDNSGTTANLSYTFDSMGRLNTMTDNVAMQELIQGATYGPANELTAITGGSYFGAWAGESRGYNSLKQLTGITSGSVGVSYAYPATGNNGKISSQTDAVSGETVTYTYDALNRLATAATQPSFSTPWGQSFAYDGFGNLTNVAVTQGSAPTFTATYDANNHAGGEDANGNPGYVPGTGRFLTPDRMTGSASDPGSWNKYGYTGGDPVNRVDHSGAWWTCPEGDIPCGDNGSDGTITEVCATVAVYGVNYAVAFYGISPSEITMDCGGGGGPTQGPGNDQGGGGGTPIHVTDLSTTSPKAIEVQNDLRFLKLLIDADPTCGAWLNSNPNAGISLDATIDFMLNVPGTGATAVTVGVGTFDSPTTNAFEGTGGTDLAPGSMTITINLNGAFWNSNANVGYGVPSNITAASYAAQALILLHELAHAMDLLANDGTLSNGQPDVADQTANNQKVLANCGNIINSFK